MVVTLLGQQYNIGKKPTGIILYTYMNRRAGTQKKSQRKQNNSTSSNMVVIIYCYIGCEAEVTVSLPCDRGWILTLSADDDNDDDVIVQLNQSTNHTWSNGKCVCVCFLCVFFPFILDFNGRTSRGHAGRRQHRIFHPPSFCGAYLTFSREKDSAIPFPRRP